VAAAIHAFAPPPVRTRSDRATTSGLCFVYDLGAGGFHCAVVDRSATADGVPMALVGSSDGVADLGGSDFDRLVRDAIRQRFAEPAARLLDGPEPTEAVRLRRLLFADTCEQVKIRLAIAETCVLAIGELDPPAVFRMRRSELIERASPLLKETYAACDRLLDGLGRDWGDIGHVLAVGAACRTTELVEPLAAHAGRPVVCVDEPGLAVARGAARCARWMLQASVRPAASDPFRPDRSPFDRST
jgi:molecular chaperone DnaK (HSP70)